MRHACHRADHGSRALEQLLEPPEAGERVLAAAHGGLVTPYSHHSFFDLVPKMILFLY